MKLSQCSLLLWFVVKIQLISISGKGLNGMNFERGPTHVFKALSLTLLIEKVFKSLLPFEADLLYTEIGLLNNYAHLKYCNT